MRKLFYFLFFIVGLTTFSQTNKIIDSLRLVLPSLKDSAKCKVILKIASQYSKIDHKKSIEWAKTGLLEAKKCKSDYYINDAYYKLGLYLRYLGKFDEALNYLDSSLYLTQKNKDEKGIAQVYNSYGSVYLDKEDYTESIKYFIASIKIKEKLNLKDILGNSYLNLGSVYNRVNMLDKAKEYFLKGLNVMLEEKNYYGVAGACNSLGVLHNREGNFNEGLTVFLKALDISDSVSDNVIKSALYGNISESYFGLGNYGKAEEFGIISYELRKKTEDINGIIYAATQLSSVYLKLKKYSLALSYAEEALKNSNEFNYLEGKYYAHKNLAEAYEALGDINKAYINLKLSISDFDSLSVAENQQAISEIESKYQLDKKESEIQLNNERLKSQDAVIKKQNQQKIFFGIGFALFALLALFIFRSYRIKKKSNEIILKRNKEVEEQKEIIEEKQKEILDSIHYAKRIQNALMSNEKQIAKNLKKIQNKK